MMNQLARSRIRNYPENLFRSGQHGVFLDLSQPYRYQDSAGTTLATADTNPLGLIYDLKNGVPGLGADVLVNGNFESGSIGWTISTTGGNSMAISGGTLNISTTGSDTAAIAQLGILTTGRFYEVSITIMGGNGNILKFNNLGSAGEHVFYCNNGTQIFRLIATSPNFVISRVVGSAAVATIDNISVKELPGSHAYQTTTTARPLLASSPKRAVTDKADDNLNIYFPSTITGTLLQSSKEGIIHAEISKAAGIWPVTVTPAYFPSDNICHLIVRDGVMSDAEVAAAKSWMVSQGAGSDFAGVTSAQNWVRARTDITKLVLSGLNFSSITTFAGFALDASNLVTVTVGSAFNAITCVNYTNAFDNCKLNQSSIDDILNSINAANTSNGTLGMTGLNNATPSAGVLAGAVVQLRARGWTITNSNGW